MTESHIPELAAVAPFTWEVQATLGGAVLQTGRIPLRFPKPVEIVGFYPSIVDGSAAGGGLVSASLDDVLVLLDANEERRFTNRLEQTAAAATGAGFVTLGALGAARAQRFLDLKLRNAAPDIGVQFRWKRDPSAGAIFEDAIVCLAFFARYLEAGE
jgi:hypothetical protein